MSIKTFTISDQINLDCRVGSGALVVHAEDGCTEAVVELVPHTESGDDRTVCELRGHTLVVRTPERHALTAKRGDHVDVTVTVPSGTAMRLEVHSGDVTTTGRTGSIALTAGSGEVDLAEVDGDLGVHSGSGAITVSSVSGDARLRDGSGDITVGRARGDLQWGTGSGDLDVDTAGGAVRGKTGSGSVTIATADGDVDVVSGSGDIRIGLRRGRQAKLDAHTGSGALRTDMPLEDSAPPAGDPISIRARTGSGDVLVERSAAPALTAG